MMPCVGDQRVLWLGLYFALGCLVAGYHAGILVFQVSHPDWKSELDHPSAAVINAITCVFYAGAIINYLFVSPVVSDRLGRRYACVAGIIVTSIGAAVQACSVAPNGVEMMLAGRAIAGSGIAVVVTAVPMYLTEIARPKMRGFVVGMCQLGFITGMVAGEWVSYTLAFWTTELVLLLGWRIAVMVQCIPAFIFGVGLPFLPESPRWLSESGTPDIARATLSWLREGASSPSQVEDELADIQYTTAQYSGSKTLALFTEKPLRIRLVCALLLQYATQLCGMAAIKHYLPVLLETMGYKIQQGMKYMIFEEASKVLFTLLGMVLVDRVGRKACLMVGCAAMASGMLANAILPMIWPMGSNAYSDKACIVAMVIFGIGYSVGLGTVSWVYSAEIFPTSLRSRAVNIAACGSALGSISMIGVWPVTGTRANPKLYFVFAGIALALIPFVWLRLPETKNRSLEDMDALFGKSSTRFQRIHDADENEDIEIGVLDCDSDSDVEDRNSDETYVEVPETAQFLQGTELK